MVHIGPTLPPSTTTSPSKTKVTPSSQIGEGNLSVARQAEVPTKLPVDDRRKKRDRRQRQQETLVDLRSGRDRRRSGGASPTIDTRA